MYGSLPTDARERHPYFMYDEIRSQPEAVARSLSLFEEHGSEALALLGGARRVFFTGCGTSYFGATFGARILRILTDGEVDARPVQAYDLVTFEPPLRPDDVLIAVTHSGGTRMTLQALDRAGQSGVETVVVTGFPSSPAAQAASVVLPTGFPEERSWAHTASYTAALASMASLANGLATRNKLDLTPLPGVMADVLGLEEMAHRLAASALVAERYQEALDIIVVGAGANAGTAEEACLKLRETSFVDAVPFQLEQMLHGPLASVEGNNLVVVLSAGPVAASRADDLVRALKRLDVTPVVVTDQDDPGSFDLSHRLLIPEVPEVLSPLPAVVPMQLFSYFLAVGKGANPDLLRRDDERYREARAEYD